MGFADPVVVIGHRGAAGLVHENTLPSFRRAYANRVSAVELDVFCVQGELVVIHDDTVERTTNGVGTVMGKTLAALRELDAGGGWPLPLLEEVVAELPERTGLNVELKGPGTAAPVAAFLERHPGLDVVVSSFDHGALAEFHQLAPAVRAAPLFHRWRTSAWDTALVLEAWSIHLNRKLATADRIAEARQRGLKTFVYTVNELEDARALVAAGADGVFTDFPDRITPAALGGRAPG